VNQPNTTTPVGQPSIRNFRPGDEQAWLSLILAAPDFPYAFFNRRPSIDALQMTLAHPAMDAAHNLFFAEVAAQLVGYAELWHAAGLKRATARVLVHPTWRRKGVGRRLLGLLEGRARAGGGTHMDIQISSEIGGGRAFLEARGFATVHRSWRMVLTQAQAVPLPRWPFGYQPRSFVVGQDERTSMLIENESFQSEWEFLPVELGEIEGFVHSPCFQAEGVIYAVYEEQVVGECWSWIDTEAAERHGDVWCLCVHPRHRRRGLGRTLLLAGVQWLRGQGVPSITLFVDGANDRARHLYESVGFVSVEEQVWYRKQL
jgi:mycothiol synthase